MKTYTKRQWENAVPKAELHLQNQTVFPHVSAHDKIMQGGTVMVDKELIAKLREKYIQNPPEGMSANEIREMDDEDLLDMDYFMHEDDEFFDEVDW